MSEPAKKIEQESEHAPSGAMEKASVPPKTFGRYVLQAPIARGGMARVYTARLVGAEGFNRLVAAKRLHPQYTDDPDFVTMFHDEARVASKIHHPNVVPVLDVVVEGSEVILVQEYVHGVPLDRLFKASLQSEHSITLGVVVAILGGVLAGLHAAHETKDEQDRPLDIVHRDVSPQNIMVSVDGIPRLLDFGIARAHSNAHVTREGLFKGKIAYMAPEQLRADGLTRAADIYAVGVLFWELITHKRMHAGRSDAEIFAAVLNGTVPTLTEALAEKRASIAGDTWQKIEALEAIVTRAMSAEPERRFATAAEMQEAVLAVCPAATSLDVAHWVKHIGSEFLEQRHKVLTATEESWRSLSKMIAAPSASPPSESVVVKRSIPTVTSDAPLARSLPPWPVSATGEPPPAENPFDSRKSKLPWVMAGALLVLSGVLVGVLSARTPAPPPAAAASVVAPPSETATAAATTTAAPTAAPTATMTASAATAAPTANANAQAPSPPATHWLAHYAPPPPKPAPAPTHASPPAATTPPPASDSPRAAPKADCDPPFYFEGTKKIYKSACL